MAKKPWWWTRAPHSRPWHRWSPPGKWSPCPVFIQQSFVFIPCLYFWIICCLYRQDTLQPALFQFGNVMVMACSKPFPVFQIMKSQESQFQCVSRIYHMWTNFTIKSNYMSNVLANHFVHHNCSKRQHRNDLEHIISDELLAPKCTILHQKCNALLQKVNSNSFGKAMLLILDSGLIFQ